MPAIMHPINRILTPFGFRVSRPGGRPRIEKVWNIPLDYPIAPEVRWNRENPNVFANEILSKQIDSYSKCLESLDESDNRIDSVLIVESENSVEPRWENDFIPVMDGYFLYTFTAKLKPKLFLEIGSGNSTKFVARAIKDYSLQTKIVSIDPVPRAEIDTICDELHRIPFEQADTAALINRLESGDIVFFDGSHRCFQNSDVTVFFNEFLWQLPRGVVVGVHDILLPYDYPPEWRERFYSEQYILAAALIAAPEKFDVIMPTFFVHSLGLSNSTLSRIYEKVPQSVSKDGSIFWFKLV